MKKRLLAVSMAAILSAVGLLGWVGTASAGPPPSVSIVMVCDKGLPPTWDHSLRGIYNISLRDGATSVGGAPTMECPEAGGRVVARRITTSAPATAAGFTCWNGTIQVGSVSGDLPLKGDCLDGGVHYAQITIR